MTNDAYQYGREKGRGGEEVETRGKGEGAEIGEWRWGSEGDRGGGMGEIG